MTKYGRAGVQHVSTLSIFIIYIQILILHSSSYPNFHIND